MKKIIYLLILSLVLCGCTKETQNTQNENTEEIIAVAEGSSSTSYRTIVSNIGTDTREIFNTVFSSNQIDATKIGRGLELISLDYFSVDDYYMKESEHMTYKIQTEETGDYFHIMKRPDVYEETSIQPWSDDIVDGVDSCVMFASLYAVDFYKSSSNGYEFGGMAITAVINPDYTDSDTGITTTYSEETIQSYAKAAIPKIYKYYSTESKYTELSTLPILIMVYEKASATDVYDGRYLYSCYCSNGSVGEIKDVNQHTYVFASDAASKADSTTASEFVLFRSKLKEASVDSVGVVATGEYFEGTIQSMTIEVNAVFKVYDEYKAIGQYIAQLLNDGAFSENFEIKVKLNNNAQTIGIIIKEKDGKASFYML